MIIYCEIGTPLQNNLTELWSLLNFLTPKLFNKNNVYQLFNDKLNVKQLGSNNVYINKLHNILKPFMLRRLKKDVERNLPPKIEIILYCKLTMKQKEWYRLILERNLEQINKKSNKKHSLLNIVMQLRKVCNHPYLFDGAEDGPPFIEGEHIINNAGKLIILNKLLIKLKQEESRVLIFCQMTRILDILEDYLNLVGYNYCRIDGQTNQEIRNIEINEFNKPNSDKFVFLLSTRAGGLGINLQTANVVILYDSDWYVICFC